MIEPGLFVKDNHTFPIPDCFACQCLPADLTFSYLIPMVLRLCLWSRIIPPNRCKVLKGEDNGSCIRIHVKRHCIVSLARRFRNPLIGQQMNAKPRGSESSAKIRKFTFRQWSISYYPSKILSQRDDKSVIANEKASNHFRDMALAHLQHCETCKLLSERPIKPSPQFNAPSVQDRPMKARSPRKFIIDRESISSDTQRGCHFSCLLQKGCSQFMKEPFENFERLEFLSDGPNSPLYVDLYREIPGSNDPSTDRTA
jgi:hypothetical protein